MDKRQTILLGLTTDAFTLYNDRQFYYFLPFFLLFLTKTSEQHKERFLVVVSFFVYFRRVSSLSETLITINIEQHIEQISAPKFKISSNRMAPKL